GQDDGYVALRHQQRHHEHGGGGDGGDADGQAVQPVDEVDAVGDADDPDDGDGHGQRAQHQRLVLAEYVGVAEHLDDHAVGHGDDGRRHLHGQLYPGVEGDDVVDGAAGDDQHRAQQYAPHRAGDVHEQ